MQSYLRKLEYATVLKHQSEFTHSQAARKLISKLTPAKSRTHSDRLRRETIAAAGLLQTGRRPCVSNLDRLGEILQALEEDVILLDASLIRSAGEALIEMDSFASVLQEHIEEQNNDVFAVYAREIPRLPELGKYYYSVIDKDGEIKKSASKKLSKLISQTAGLRQRLSQKIERISVSLSSRGILREAPPTVRDGCHVLPVIATHRRSVKGIVHDRSESGGTFFIEPEEVVSDGNELREAVLDMEYEIRRILKEATGRLRERKTEIQRGYEIFTELDAIYARAEYHLKNKTVFPEEGATALLKLRHPLIPNDEMIPNDVILPVKWKVLVVSGPNAGGKSVLLKSIGLAVACSQSGVGAFVSPGSTLPFFSNVLVSLGDNQSISEHESTYSARLREQLEMLNTLKAGGLALIDEPAGGTDPVTGTALALSVLDYLAASGCKAIVTTHMGQLKNSARDRDGFINGSMNFAIESLEPDYRFRLGLPGSSYTLEIADRMDFPDEVLTRAKEMSGESFRLDNLIEELSKKTTILDREITDNRKETAESLEKNTKLRLELESEITELDKMRRRILEENEEKAREYNSRADSLLTQLGQTQDISERKEIRKKIRDMADTIPVKKESEPADRESNIFEVGDSVAVSGWEGTGVIEEVSNDNCVIRMGNVRLRCSTSDLTPADVSETTVLSIAYNASVDAGPEIDLRGMSAEEAIAELDTSIDDCISAGMTIIRVIHGKGEGILMRAVNRSMKSDRRVLSHRMGEPAEGGTGVTVAELRK